MAASRKTWFRLVSNWSCHRTVLAENAENTPSITMRPETDLLRILAEKIRARCARRQDLCKKGLPLTRVGCRQAAMAGLPRRPGSLRIRKAIWLAVCLSAPGAAVAQKAEPSLESPACVQTREALDRAQRAHDKRDPATTQALERARWQAQAACLGADTPGAPSVRNTTGPAVSVPQIGMPAPPGSVKAPAIALPPPGPRALGPCDATGCWDDQGRRLNGGGGMLGAPGGGICSVQGSFATCP